MSLSGQAENGDYTWIRDQDEVLSGCLMCVHQPWTGITYNWWTQPTHSLACHKQPYLQPEMRSRIQLDDGTFRPRAPDSSSFHRGVFTRAITRRPSGAVQRPIAPKLCPPTPATCLTKLQCSGRLTSLVLFEQAITKI